MKRYSVAEVLQFAVRIEENGAFFYGTLAVRFVALPDVSTFFGDLARQEGDHLVFFQRLYRDLDQEETALPLDEEYFRYLRPFADGAVFDLDRTAAQCEGIKGLPEAIQFSLEREQASIAFYEGLKQAVPLAEHAGLDAVIAEEHAHIQQLIAFRDSRPKATNMGGSHD